MGVADPGAQAGFGDMLTGTEQVGAFTYLVATGKWWLDAATRAMHGLSLTAEVTTAQLWSFKHPEDVAQASELLTKVLAVGEPFCFPHRIVDAAGREHSIVVIGNVRHDQEGTVDRIKGYTVDITDAQASFARRAGDQAVQAAAEHRQAIEQAKGALMLAYGISPDAAVALLRWHSQQHNVRLNLIAERLVQELRRTQLAPSGVRNALDRVLHDAGTQRPDG